MNQNSEIVFYESGKMGIYIHFPYCIQKCSYCDFYSIGVGKNFFQQEEYFQTLHIEIEQRLKEFPWENFLVSSVFLGGGTPSLASFPHLHKLFKTIREYFSFTIDCEWTMEANPEDINFENLEKWKDLGINRISVGVQSFHPKVLEFLGRYHDKDKYFQVLELLSKKIISRYGIDLIYGIPNQTIEMFYEDINRALSHNLEHLSCYALTLEKGTEYSRKVYQKENPPPNEELQTYILKTLPSYLSKKGLAIYEVSNFAKLGNECKHNLQYWKMLPYLGLGVSAHGFTGNARYANPRSLQVYMKQNFGFLKQENSLYLDFLLCTFRIMKKINLQSFESFWIDRDGFESKLESWSKKEICFWDKENFQWNLDYIHLLDSYIYELADLDSKFL